MGVKEYAGWAVKNPLRIMVTAGVVGVGGYIAGVENHGSAPTDIVPCVVSPSGARAECPDGTKVHLGKRTITIVDLGQKKTVRRNPEGDAVSTLPYNTLLVEGKDRATRIYEINLPK